MIVAYGSRKTVHNSLGQYRKTVHNSLGQYRKTVHNLFVNENIIRIYSFCPFLP